MRALVVVLAMVAEFALGFLARGAVEPARLIPPLNFTNTPRVSESPSSRGFVRPALPADPSSAVARSTSPSDAEQHRPSVTTQGPDGPELLAHSSSGHSAPPASSAKAGEAVQAGYLKLRAAIAWCESRNTPTAVNKTSGASGTYQFMAETWRAVTGLPGSAGDYPESVQDAAFDALYKADGTAPWWSSKWCWSKRVAS